MCMTYYFGSHSLSYPLILSGRSSNRFYVSHWVYHLNHHHLQRLLQEKTLVLLFRGTKLMKLVTTVLLKCRKHLNPVAWHMTSLNAECRTSSLSVMNPFPFSARLVWISIPAKNQLWHTTSNFNIQSRT